MNNKENIRSANFSIIKDALAMSGGAAYFRKKDFEEFDIPSPKISACSSEVETYKYLSDWISANYMALAEMLDGQTCDYIDSVESDLSVYAIGLYLVDGRVLMDALIVDDELNIMCWAKQDILSFEGIDLEAILMALDVKVSYAVRLLERKPKRKDETALQWAVADGHLYRLSQNTGVALSLKAVKDALAETLKRFI